MSEKARAWRHKLVGALPQQAFPEKLVQNQARYRKALAKNWPLADEPAKRTLHPSDKDPENLQDKLRENLPERAAPLNSSGSGNDGCDGDNGGGETGKGGSSGDDPYAEISEEDYEDLASAWHKENATAEQQRQPIRKPPLNPQQRAVTRDFLRVVQNVRQFKRNQDNPATFQQQLQKDGLNLALLMMGAGGTGKSMVVHELDARIKAMGMHLLVTAYTGVASAPFGGPTLLSLLNLSPTTQKRKEVRDLTQAQIQNVKDKFKSESGIDIEHVGGIVIDEISFVEASQTASSPISACRVTALLPSLIKP